MMKAKRNRGKGGCVRYSFSFLAYGRLFPVLRRYLVRIHTHSFLLPKARHTSHLARISVLIFFPGLRVVCECGLHISILWGSYRNISAMRTHPCAFKRECIGTELAEAENENGSDARRTRAGGNDGGNGDRSRNGIEGRKRPWYFILINPRVYADIW